MKTKTICRFSFTLSLLLSAAAGRADDITAIKSGNWSDPTVWLDSTTGTNQVPGANDDADIPSGITVTVDTDVTVQFIYDSGTVNMGANSSLNLTQDAAIDTLTTLITTAPNNTVIYSANPFAAKQTNYYNLVFATTNYVDAHPPYVPWQDFNNFSSPAGPTPMTIAGNMILMGAVKVQQGSGGAPITVNGDLVIGSGCAWDCSGDILTVGGNVYVNGLLEDLNGALGTNHVHGSVIVAGPGTSSLAYTGGVYTNGWFVSDVTAWGVDGGLTNNGSIFGSGFGSVTFNGTGTIAGTNALTLPTMTVNGTYAIGTTITLITNTPTLNGTLIFNLANTNQIVLLTNAGTAFFYSGNLNVINSGPAPVSGASYKLFNCANGFGGAFTATSFPSLPAGLSWVDNTLTTGSIDVTGGPAGNPILTILKSGTTATLSWDSTTFPGYSVQGQTNSAGITANWGATSSGTISPFIVTIGTNKSVFFRLSKP